MSQQNETQIHHTRPVGDTSNWKDHDSYQGAFDRLVWDLKASQA